MAPKGKANPGANTSPDCVTVTPPAKKHKGEDLQPTATPPSPSAGGSTTSGTCAEEVIYPDPGWPSESQKAKLRVPQYMRKVIPFARQHLEKELQQNKKLRENLNRGVEVQAQGRRPRWR